MIKLKAASLFVWQNLKKWVKMHKVTTDFSTVSPNNNFANNFTIGLNVANNDNYALLTRSRISNNGIHFYSAKIEVKLVEIVQKAINRESKTIEPVKIVAKKHKVEVLPNVWIKTALVIKMSWICLLFFNTLKEVYTHYGNSDYCGIQFPRVERSNQYSFLLSQTRKKKLNWRFFLPTHLVNKSTFLEQCAKENIPNYYFQSVKQQQVSLVIVFNDFKHFNGKVQKVLYVITSLFSAITIFSKTRSILLNVVTQNLKWGNSVFIELVVLIVSFGIVQALLFTTGWAFITILIVSFRGVRNK